MPMKGIVIFQKVVATMRQHPKFKNSRNLFFFLVSERQISYQWILVKNTIVSGSSRWFLWYGLLKRLQKQFQ